MDIIKKKVEESIKLLDLFREYYHYFKIGFQKLKPKIVSKLEDNIFDKYPERRKKLLDRIKSLNLKVFMEIEPIDQQKLIFQTYYLLKQFDNIIEDIYQIIKKYSFENSEFIDSELTSSIINNSIEKEQKLRKQYKNFVKIYNKFTEINVTEQFSQIVINLMKDADETEIQKQINNINLLFKKYINTIHLYSHIMQYILDCYSDKKYKIITELIMKLIEQDKAYILQPNTFISKPKKITSKRGPQNPFLRNFGLVPSGKFKLIDQLFPKLKNNTSENIDTLFNKISKETKINIIVLQNITSNPISHELWNLIDIQNANSYGSENSGITENLIKKTTTIVKLKPEQKSWTFGSYKIFGSEDVNNFYIIETLNNKLFRFLRHWISLSSSNNLNETVIPASKINGFLNYLNIHKKLNKNTPKSEEIDRISIYQNIQEKSLENMFFKKTPPNIETLIEKSQFMIDSTKIKSECLFRIRDIINKTIKTIKNPIDQIGYIMHYSVIFDIFISTIFGIFWEYYDIIKKIERHEQNSQKNIKIQFPEIFSTYLYEIKSLKYQFARALHNEYIKKIDNNKIEIQSISTKEKLIVYIEKMIQTVLNELISQDKNIYQSIYFKYNLLKVEIL